METDYLKEVMDFIVGMKDEGRFTEEECKDYQTIFSNMEKKELIAWYNFLYTDIFDLNELFMFA